MYKFQSYFYLNRIDKVVRQFQSKKEIPHSYRKKIVVINLDVTYNSNGYIDRKSKLLISETMVREQQKAPPIAYFKINYWDVENDLDDEDYDGATSTELDEYTVDVSEYVADSDDSDDSDESAEDEDSDYFAENVDDEEEEINENEDDAVVIPEDHVMDDNLSLY